MLPHVNGVLNSVVTVLLLVGYGLIRSGRRDAHMKVMIAALLLSVIFLVSYVIHRFHAPIFVFPGEGWQVPVYYFILISHVILAVVNLPMIIITVLRALRGTFERHKALARWTLPVWLYVSVTGVVVYVWLYLVYGSPHGPS